MNSVQTLKDVRLINRMKILQIVYFQGPISRLKICESTGLSPATVGNLISPMINEGIIEEAGFEESNGGRRRVILETNREYGFFMGVDIGRTYIQVEIFDFRMTLRGNGKKLINLDRLRPDLIKDTLISECSQLMRKYDIAMEQLLGIGIALPGFVDNETGELIWSPYGEWRGMNIKKMLRDWTDLPISVDNGSKAMAIAEHWFGQGKDFADTATLILGRGIGSGIISQGQLLRGSQNFAGEWGHTLINFPNGGGKASTVEESINRSLNRLWESVGTGNIPDPQDEVESLARLLSEKDPQAMQVLEEIIEILSVGLANLIYIFNPERIIIGGWMGIRLYDYLFPRITDILKDFCLPVSVGKIGFRTSEFGEGDSCIGASCLALEKYLSLHI